MAEAQPFGYSGWTEAQAGYVTNFTTIELQATFYEPPLIAVAKRCIPLLHERSATHNAHALKP